MVIYAREQNLPYPKSFVLACDRFAARIWSSDALDAFDRTNFKTLCDAYEWRLQGLGTGALGRFLLSDVLLVGKVGRIF
jgi:hypothetical protein